jgi:hypothetical protein
MRMTPASDRLRCGMVSLVTLKVPVRFDREDRLPLVGVHLLHRGRGTGDAGVVDQDVDAAQRAGGGLDEALDRGAVGHVAHGRGDRRIRVGDLLQRRLIDVADVHAVSAGRERRRDREADAAGSRRHHDPPSVGHR